MLFELMRWCFILIMLMAVVAAALYRRTGVMAHHALSDWRPMRGRSGSGGGEFVELWRLAYAAGLGGAAVLRPFVRPGSPDLYATSPPEAYKASLETPEFVRLPWVLAFVFCLVVVGFSSFVLVGPVHLFGKELRALLLAGSTMRDLFGADAGTSIGVVVIHQFEALNWMMTAFIGAYIWSIGYLLWRMGQRDVTGHVFNTVSVRMLVAGLMGVVLFHIFGDSADIGGLPLLLPLAAGLVPQWVMAWVLRKVQAMLQSEEEQRTQLSLTLLEGIDELVRVRLSEAGVDDAQGLAAVNPVRLALQTPFPFVGVVDWIGQAQLLLHAKPDKFRKLSERGVRTSCDLLALDDTTRAALGTDIGLDLAVMAKTFAAEPTYLRHAEIVRRMAALSPP